MLNFNIYLFILDDDNNNNCNFTFTLDEIKNVNESIVVRELTFYNLFFFSYILFCSVLLFHSLLMITTETFFCVYRRALIARDCKPNFAFACVVYLRVIYKIYFRCCTTHLLYAILNAARGTKVKKVKQHTQKKRSKQNVFGLQQRKKLKI